MERFAKRKIKIFDYLNCYRVFYCEDNGHKYHVGDYHTKNIDFIANDIKTVWMKDMKRAGKFYLVQKEEKSSDAIVDSEGKLKIFCTKEDCYNFIFAHSYTGMSFKYEIKELEDESDV